MSFIQYIKDKRYFLMLYAGMMGFISIIMTLSFNPALVLGNLLYIHIVCFALVAAYLLIGYYYRRSYYRKLQQLIHLDREDWPVVAPEPQNLQQRLYLELFTKLHRQHERDLRKLNEEKIDHQEFILSWIHEVKLPIAASRLLMENSTGETADSLADKLEDELDKIENYVEQALYYSRIDSFSKDYFITEEPLDSIIKTCAKKFAKTFINKRIRFHMEDIRQTVHTDRKWLGFILDQIVANALKYTNEGGTITFTVEEDRQEKRMHIIDSGIGIQPEDLHRVFEKGFTGSIGRSHAKSTGMGLYLANQLVHKLGHHLSIQSEAGAYTKVTIHFPKTDTYHSLL
ncbi:sensor histidine kinase [Paenibacillus lautus]|uniref:sensor histidine kinase n=1 Tax=Paenibacillus lautus TaxID=1401 RepID=UPI001C11B67D|nr:sensor histidine kinase [Paenibacillus lautus]MBU5346173.1 sensor histidine kinase [Paenibacillus lautus]